MDLFRSFVIPEAMIVTRGMEYINWARLGVMCPFLESGSGDQPYQNYKDLGGEEWYLKDNQGASSEGAWMLTR